ncbi:MAG: MBOAT family protein [Alphaproteobacteria bacterium]|nr:MBOAT family protein [Alphaproteobacteria bacterium]
MVFSSIPFLFYFLPLVLSGYYLLRSTDARNYGLLAASLLFYTWGGGIFVLILLASITANYWFGRMAAHAFAANNRKQLHASVIGSVIVNIGLLGYYKYINFFIAEFNRSASFFGFAQPIAWDSIILPIGISFFTFQSMSYVFDIARGICPPQRRFSRFALYVALFPQLIAGPIVRYQDIAAQIPARTHSASLFYEGMFRFVHGLVKKVVLADAAGAVAESCFGLPAEEMTTSAAWLGAVAYSLQIYFDFSAYSDMAIGLGKMLGFHFPENFRRPYSALSITDFWRRWHITLSTWIREYLYIPLGGNRVSTKRLYANLLVVFFLTGLWHGANWTFILWGLYHGVLLIIERLFGRSSVPPSRTSIVMRRAVTLVLVIIGWVLFRAVDVTQALTFYQHMFLHSAYHLPLDVQLSLTHRHVLTLILSLMVFILPQHWHASRLLSSDIKTAQCYRWVLLLLAFPYALLLVCSGTFSPFLYFQF